MVLLIQPRSNLMARLNVASKSVGDESVGYRVTAMENTSDDFLSTTILWRDVCHSASPCQPTPIFAFNHDQFVDEGVQCQSRGIRQGNERQIAEIICHDWHSRRAKTLNLQIQIKRLPNMQQKTILEGGVFRLVHFSMLVFYLFEENCNEQLKMRLIAMFLTMFCGIALAQLLLQASKKYIRDLKYPPNAPMTIRQKGSSNPLIDKGNMINAIDFRGAFMSISMFGHIDSQFDSQLNVRFVPVVVSEKDGFFQEKVSLPISYTATVQPLEREGAWLFGNRSRTYSGLSKDLHQLRQPNKTRDVDWLHRNDGREMEADFC